MDRFFSGTVGVFISAWGPLLIAFDFYVSGINGQKYPDGGVIVVGLLIIFVGVTIAVLSGDNARKANRDRRIKNLMDQQFPYGKPRPEMNQKHYNDLEQPMPDLARGRRSEDSGPSFDDFMRPRAGRPDQN